MNIKKETKFKISEQSILFLKKYAISALHIQSKIDKTDLEKIQDLAVDWELDMIDENGTDRTENYPEKERNEWADLFVSELSGQWINQEPDFDDLNKRLGLSLNKS